MSPIDDQHTDRAWGRQLADLWLNNEAGLLLPAERKLLDCAARGNPCELSEIRPEQSTDENAVRPGVLRFIALGGDKNHPLHEHGVRLRGAFVAGDVNLNGATLPARLDLLECMIDGDLNLRECRAKSVALAGCRLGSLKGNGFECSGAFVLENGFEARGSVELVGARIDKDFNCNGARFQAQDISLKGERLTVGSSLLLGREFTAIGNVRLDGATIGGSLDCTEGSFFGQEDALVLDGSKIGGDCLLNNGFHAIGKVSLDGCSIDGRLSCTNSTFSSTDQALYAPRIKVGGNVNLGEECRIGGQISLQGSTIDGDLVFSGGAFDRRVKWSRICEVTCINLRNARIAGTLFWRQVKIARGELNLSGASCLTLNMEWESWNKPSQVRLDSFTYKGFNQLDETTSASFWLDWIERQPQSHLTTKFRPKPYQQLADVLQSMGHEEEARTVRIERKRRQAEFVRLYEKTSSDPVSGFYRILNNFWSNVQGITVGYGYRPGKAALWLACLVGLGWLVYSWAAVQGIMTPTHPLIYKEAVWDPGTGPLEPPKIPAACHENWVYPQGRFAEMCGRAIPSEYSTFNALIYSADVAIPVVNFRMENDWAPRVVNWKSGKPDTLGFLVRTWEWIQIGLGWALSLLFVSAIGGVIRRD